MKIKKVKPNLERLLARLSLVAAISLFSLSCTAQSVWEASEVKARESVFSSEKHDKYFSIRNSNYIDPMKTRKQYDINRFDFSYVSLVSHDSFLEAFKKSFTNKKLTKLSETGENVDIVFNADERGQILGIRFRLLEGTTILPEELEKLEQELLSRVKFIVIGEKVEDLIFHRVHFRVNFSEVQDGEIRSVRNSENLKTRY